jgi:hypothetical protein
MSTTYGAQVLGQAVVSKRAVAGFFGKCRDALQVQRTRRKLVAAVEHLSDWELRDIGLTGGEGDHMASNRFIESRGILSPEWVRRLPILDEQFEYFQPHQNTENDICQWHFRL